MSSTQFKDKVVIVTGSSSGIGAATAILAASRGARVTIHGRRKEKLNEVAQQIEKASGEKPVIVVGEITSSDVRQELVDATLKEFGRIDVLVNNAGGGLPTSWQTDISSLREMLEQHVVAPCELSQKVMPELIKNKGNIIMVSSIGGLRGPQGMLHYAAAKGGMQNLMKSLAADVAALGVRVNAINPGFIDTDFFRTDMLAQMANMMKQPGKSPHPNKRVGTPLDVAELICFVASDAAVMITASTHVIDGGSNDTIIVADLL